MRHTLRGALVALLLAAPALAATGAIAPPTIDDGVVIWTPEAPFAEAFLTISATMDASVELTFGIGEAIRFDPAATNSPDGFVLYDLTLVGDDETARTQTGALEIRNGRAVESPVMATVLATADGVIRNSLCVGSDCPDSPSFGFSTVKLQENNIQVHFEDTSNSASFATRDWKLVANDTNNGGDNYFAIRDAGDDGTSAVDIFRVAAGAPASSLWVDSAGDVGIGVPNAVLELHIRDGDSPGIRLEQDASSGFSARTWDVAANETSFFIRDATGGSALPFRVFAGSLTNTLRVAPAGVIVGPGGSLSTAGASLDVRGVTATERIIIGADDLAAVPGDATLDVDGFSRFRDRVRIAGAVPLDGNLVTQGNVTGRGQLNFVGDYGGSGTVLRIRDNVLNTNILYSYGNGNLLIGGTLIQSSDASVKENVVPVNPEAILQGVAAMPISTWEYIADEDDSVHLGPMAQDFRAAFGLGMNDTTIASVDADGVALASVQALLARSEADRARIAELEAVLAESLAENASLSARLDRMEALMAEVPHE